MLDMKAIIWLENYLQVCWFVVLTTLTTDHSVFLDLQCLKLCNEQMVFLHFDDRCELIKCYACAVFYQDVMEK